MAPILRHTIGAVAPRLQDQRAARLRFCHEFRARSRHQIRIFLPSGIVKDLTGMNPSERAAASTFPRVMGAPGRSPVMSAFAGCGESS